MRSLLQKLAEAASPFDKQSEPESSSTSESNGTKKDEKPSDKEKEVPEEEVVEEPAAVPEEAVAPEASTGGAAIIDFFKQNPAPTDEEFHAFCDQSGMDTPVAETAAYRLAGMFVEFITGGNGYGISPDQFDPNQIEKGIQVESEHTENPVLQLKIVLDHLAEIPDYYDPWLEEMESMAKEQSSGQPGQPAGAGTDQVPTNGKTDSNDQGYQAGGGQGNAFDTMNQNPTG